MNSQHLNINDTEHTLLWHILESTRKHHVTLCRIPVGIADKLKRHKKQVTDLYNELRRTLDNYHKWTSGKDLTQALVDLVIELETYRSEVFDRPQNRQPNQAQAHRNSIAKRFRDRQDNFQEILGTLRNHFRGNQAQ